MQWICHNSVAITLTGLLFYLQILSTSGSSRYEGLVTDKAERVSESRKIHSVPLAFTLGHVPSFARKLSYGIALSRLTGLHTTLTIDRSTTTRTIAGR